MLLQVACQHSILSNRCSSSIPMFWWARIQSSVHSESCSTCQLNVTLKHAYQVDGTHVSMWRSKKVDQNRHNMCDSVDTCKLIIQVYYSWVVQVMPFGLSSHTTFSNMVWWDEWMSICACTFSLTNHWKKFGAGWCVYLGECCENLV
jgi:hypothetical protein